MLLELKGRLKMDVNKTTEILTTKFEHWYESIISMLPNLALALVIFIAFWIGAKIVQKYTGKALKKSDFNVNLNNLITSALRITIIGLGLVFALGVLKLDKTVMSFLAGLGVAGIAIGFAFQDLASNFISGIMIAVRSPFKIGDVIMIGSTLGTVMDIKLRDTVIKNFDGQIIIVPNKDFMSKEITNYAANGERKVKITVGVGYQDDLNKAKRVIREAIENQDYILKEPEMLVFCDNFGASSMDIQVHFWIKYPGGDIIAAKDDAIIRIKKELDENGFDIPFPIRTLSLPDSLTQSLAK